METTYCPQDNKLRLYVGRVEHEEYLALRSEGWTSTPKQDCDFVATWTPEREDTAIKYGDGIVGDEDQTPQDRAVDRAERFAMYRDKRTEEALEHADKYEGTSKAHGFQDPKKAERAAKKHDRLGDKATSQWAKADYWVSRTAGVIKHALYTDLPAVRMTRIKKIETTARRTAGRTDERGRRWNEHCKMRLVYERLMIDAQGGMAEDLDIEVGGMFAGQLIHGVTKSPATKRASSVKLMARTQYGANKGKMELHSFKIERYGKSSYTPPTDETLAQLAEIKKATKEARKLLPKKPSLINPTLAEAERLQSMLNEGNKHPQTVLQVTQEQYAARSKGTYSYWGTKELCGGGKFASTSWNAQNTPTICKLRTAPGDSGSMSHGAPTRLIVLTDKPSKAMPADVWVDPAVLYLEDCKADVKLIELWVNHDEPANFDYSLINKAKVCRLVYSASSTQRQWTEQGVSVLFPLLKNNERV